MAFKDFSKKIVDNITKGLLQNYQNFTSQNQSSWVMGRLNGDGTATLPDGSTVKVITRGITSTYVRLFNMGNGTWLADVPSSGHVQADGFTENPYMVVVKNLQFLNGGVSGVEVAVIDKLGNKFTLPERYWPQQYSSSDTPNFITASSMVVSAGFGGFVIVAFPNGAADIPQRYTGPAPPNLPLINISIIHQFSLVDGEVVVRDEDFESKSFNVNNYLRTVPNKTVIDLNPVLSVSGEADCNSGVPSTITGSEIILESGRTSYGISSVAIPIRGRTSNNKLITDLVVSGGCSYDSSQIGHFVSSRYSGYSPIYTFYEFTLDAVYHLVKTTPINSSEYDYVFEYSNQNVIIPEGIPPSTTSQQPGGSVQKRGDLGCETVGLVNTLKLNANGVRYSFTVLDWSTNPELVDYQEKFTGDPIEDETEIYQGILTTSNPEIFYTIKSKQISLINVAALRLLVYEGYSNTLIYSTTVNDPLGSGNGTWPLLLSNGEVIPVESTTDPARPVNLNTTRNKIGMRLPAYEQGGFPYVLLQGTLLNVDGVYDIFLVNLSIDNSNFTYNTKQVFNLGTWYQYLGVITSLSNSYRVSFGVDYTR